jgi:hypothetical protein
MNLVKNKFRSMKHLCNMHGPSVMEFDPAKIVDHWFFNSTPTIHSHKKPNETPWKYVYSSFVVLLWNVISYDINDHKFLVIAYRATVYSICRWCTEFY